MTKEEILKQAQSEGKKSMDERDLAIQDKACYVGMLVGLFFCLFLMVLKIFRNLPFQDVYAVICSINCAQHLYKWTRYKTDRCLALGIGWGALTVLLVFAYLTQIW